MNQVFAWPVGRAREDDQRKRAPAAPVTAYVASLIMGACLTSAGLAAAGRFVTTDGGEAPIIISWVLGGVVGAVATVAQHRGRIAPLPERRRQVPTGWLAWSSTRTAIGFGLMIGMSVFTLLHHATIYVLGVLLFVNGSIGLALQAGAAYGLLRGLPLVLAWWRPQRPREMSDASIYRSSVSAARLLPAVAFLTFLASAAFSVVNA